MGLLPFIKLLKVSPTQRFVLIKENLNFKHKYDDKQFKCKIIFSLGYEYLLPNDVFSLLDYLFQFVVMTIWKNYESYLDF